MADTDIFLSYSREDRAAARHFAESFAREGFNVWWDAAIRPGQTFDEVIEKQLRSAEAVVVLWSPRSVASRWVRAEATLADRRGILVPAIIETCNLPLIFELTHAADLSGWTGDTSDARWQALVSDLRRIFDGNEDNPSAHSGRDRPSLKSATVSAAPATPRVTDGIVANDKAMPANSDDILFAPARLDTDRASKLSQPTPLEEQKTQFYKRSDEFRRQERERVHCLQKLDGELSQTRFVVGSNGLTIGRAPPAEIIVAGSGVSRAHCTVELDGDDILVVDLNSTNGTYIDNKRITGAAILPVGSVLRVGNVSLEHEALTNAEMQRHLELAGFHGGTSPGAARLARSS